MDQVRIAFANSLDEIESYGLRRYSRSSAQTENIHPVDGLAYSCLAGSVGNDADLVFAKRHLRNVLNVGFHSAAVGWISLCNVNDFHRNGTALRRHLQ